MAYVYRPSLVFLRRKPITSANTTMVRIGMGMLIIEPCPIMRNVSGRLRIVSPPVNAKAKPRATLIIPRVAMNGGRFAFVISKPVAIPAIAADSTPRTPFNRTAVTTPDRPKTEPTERSIPPEMMTTDCPTAMMAIKETALNTWERLDQLRKVESKKWGPPNEEVRTVRMRTSASNATQMPSCLPFKTAIELCVRLLFCRERGPRGSNTYEISPILQRFSPSCKCG